MIKWSRLSLARSLALADGCEPPADFNVALLVFIPKGGVLPGMEGYEARAAQFRPLTLSNSCQKFIAKAFGVTLKRIAAAVTHPAQRGFVRDRKMLANVLDTQLALEEAVILGMEPRALVLFDVAAALPSAVWAWTWSCLDFMGLPA